VVKESVQIMEHQPGKDVFCRHLCGTRPLFAAISTKVKFHFCLFMKQL